MQLKFYAVNLFWVFLGNAVIKSALQVQHSLGLQRQPNDSPNRSESNRKNSGKTDLSCGIVIKVSQLSWSTYRAQNFKTSFKLRTFICSVHCVFFVHCRFTCAKNQSLRNSYSSFNCVVFYVWYQCIFMPFVCLKMSHVQKWKVFLIYLFICEKAKMKLTKCTT